MLGTRDVGVGGEESHESYVDEEEIEQIGSGYRCLAAAAVARDGEVDGCGRQGEDDEDQLKHSVMLQELVKGEHFLICSLKR